MRRATLREWRREFARYLRGQGQGASTQHRARQEAVARELAGGQIKTDPGKGRLLETRSHPRVIRQSSVQGLGKCAFAHIFSHQPRLA